MSQILDQDIAYRESTFYKLLMEHDKIYVEKLREQVKEMTALANIFVKNGQDSLYRLTVSCIDGLKQEAARWIPSVERKTRYGVGDGRQTQDDTSATVHRNISFVCKESH